jgi:FAD/FMN-containing dehydrogenase
VTATPIDVAGRDGGPVRMSLERLDELTSRIEGRLLRPGDEGWDSSVLVWNALAARTPALVVQPVSAHDVAVAVGLARDHGLLLSVKGGGHNIAGTSLADRGLTLDLARMRDVTVDAAARRVDVGPGCLLQDVDRATQRHGLATVLGFISEVGVAGLTLGGGFGYLMRRFGWAVDNLHEVQIVTADGAIRTANREINAELFWALRGGGGNFGVVTRFTFLLHPVGPTITGGLILWDAARAEEVLSAYRVLTESAPRELAAAVAIRIAPPAPFIPQHWHGRHIIGILVCHSGAAADADADLTAVRALGDPIVDLIAERPYIEQQSMMDGTEPKGQHYYWKAEHLPALSSRFLEAFRDGALKVPTVHSESVIFHIGGAANEHAADDGAVGNRDARYITGFAGAWPAGASPDSHVAWVQAAWQTIRPFSTGGNYVNFQLAEDDTARTADAYGGNFERLRRAKATYDPHNVFRVNRNITPTVPARSVDADPDDILPPVTAAGT